MYGDPVTIEGSDLLARCVQHETDHLNGILFIDRLDREQRWLALKAIREAEWAGMAAPVVRTSPHAMFGKALYRVRLVVAGYLRSPSPRSTRYSPPGTRSLLSSPVPTLRPDEAAAPHVAQSRPALTTSASRS